MSSAVLHGKDRRDENAITRPAVFALVLAINERLPIEDDWLRVSPFGVFPITIVDGTPRRIVLSIDRAAANAIVDSFHSKVSRPPIYIGHPDDQVWHSEHLWQPAEAVGRLRALDVRADGIWARRAMNEKGRALIEGDAPAYDSFSPR